MIGARGAQRAGRLALVVGSLLLAAGLAEALLRAAGFRYSPVHIGTNVRDDFREEHAFRDRHLVYDPDLIWRPVTGQFSPFNPQGFRGAPIAADRPAGTLRIVAIGDSNTFGWDVDDGANWPSQLQALLASTRPDAEVINAGVWGYSSFQGLRRFREMVAFRPDVALVSFGGNDAHQVLVPDAEYVRRHDRIDRVSRATRRSRLAQLVVAAWDRAGALTGASGTIGPRVPLEDYSAHLRAMISEGKTLGIRVVLLTRPYVGSSTDPLSWKTHAPSYNAATLDIARAERIPVVDVYAAFKDRPELFDDESHFGVRGHRLAAELIHAELSRFLTQ